MAKPKFKTYRKARAEALASGASEEAIAEALATISRLQDENRRLTLKLVEYERTAAWSTGRRGDGIERVPGFTVTETRVLRILASTGEVRYDRMESLQRHMSNIRKKLPPGIKIKTIVMQGYEVTQGLNAIKRMVSAEALNPVRPLDGVGVEIAA